MTRTSIEIDSGCLYIGGAVEFDDRPGPVRDALVSSVRTWLGAMRRAVVQARDEGHLRADLDVDQLLFEVHGQILALHYEARFLKLPGALARATAGFDHAISRCLAAAAPTARGRAARTRRAVSPTAKE